MQKDQLQIMLDTQKSLQEFLGYDFESMDMQDRTIFIKEFSIHLNQEINEALYELPYFKPWKDYENMTEEETIAALRRYKEELVDAFHFFMNMMVAIDFDAGEFFEMYMDKNKENIARQQRGYTHDVSYR